MKTPNFHDVEQISALLDGKLSQAETIKLESRIKANRNLQALKNDLAETRGMLRRLPQRRAPRNFTLTLRMAGVKPPIPRAVPGLRFATVLASFLLVFSLATNALAPSFRQAAQAPTYGMGGGGGGAEGPGIMAAEATEAPAQEQAPSSESLPAATLVPTDLAGDSSRVDLTPTPEASLKAPAPEQPGPDQQPGEDAESQVLPVSPSWIAGFLVIALICGGLAWLLSWSSERSWRAKTK